MTEYGAVQDTTEPAWIQRLARPHSLLSLSFSVVDRHSSGQPRHSVDAPLHTYTTPLPPSSHWILERIKLTTTKRPTIVRSSLDIGTSSTVVEFLTDLGCRMDFEYAARGYMFRKGRMKITVAKIFKMLHGKPTDPVETISQSYLVELSVLAPCGQDAIAEDMRSFSEQLRPLVQLEKVDFNRLHHLT
uniref:Mediator of RNA polymerase II transcription subunit 18 n=1 Tax=Timema tahoe TaxID=61484 RepID=A0A7R9NZQ9_9NEOP|nr:unnamed protein product [Timema tahoe]